MKTLYYQKFPKKVKSFLENYFKVSKDIFKPLYISFEKRPENYPSLVCAEFIPPSKIAYYKNNVKWEGIVHDVTHFIQYQKNPKKFEENRELTKEAVLDNKYSIYRENPLEREAREAQEEFRRYSELKLSWLEPSQNTLNFEHKLKEYNISFYKEGNTYIIDHNGDVYLHSLTQLPNNIQFNNGGSVYLNSLEQLPDNIQFNNGGSVNLNSLEQLPDNIQFNNGDYVYLNSLRQLPDNKYEIFKNGGVVYYDDWNKKFNPKSKLSWQLEPLPKIFDYGKGDIIKVEDEYENAKYYLINNIKLGYGKNKNTVIINGWTSHVSIDHLLHQYFIKKPSYNEYESKNTLDESETVFLGNINNIKLSWQEGYTIPNIPPGSVWKKKYVGNPGKFQYFYVEKPGKIIKNYFKSKFPEYINSNFKDSDLLEFKGIVTDDFDLLIKDYKLGNTFSGLGIFLGDEWKNDFFYLGQMEDLVKNEKLSWKFIPYKELTPKKHENFLKWDEKRQKENTQKHLNDLLSNKANILANVNNGKYGVIITKTEGEEYREPDGTTYDNLTRPGREFYYKIGSPIIVPAGYWMDWWEPEHGITEEEYKKLSMRERAKLEAQLQLEKYTPEQYAQYLKEGEGEEVAPLNWEKLSYQETPIYWIYDMQTGIYKKTLNSLEEISKVYGIAPSHAKRAIQNNTGIKGVYIVEGQEGVKKPLKIKPRLDRESEIRGTKIIGVNPTTGKEYVFNSVREAERELGINRISIVHVLKGRQNSAGGWKWRYAEGEKNEKNIDKSKWLGRRFTLKGATPLEVVDIKEGEIPIIVMKDRSTGKIINYTPQTFATALQEGILVEESSRLSWQTPPPGSRLKNYTGFLVKAYFKDWDLPMYGVIQEDVVEDGVRKLIGWWYNTPEDALKYSKEHSPNIKAWYTRLRTDRDIEVIQSVGSIKSKFSWQFSRDKYREIFEYLDNLMKDYSLIRNKFQIIPYHIKQDIRDTFNLSPSEVDDIVYLWKLEQITENYKLSRQKNSPYWVYDMKTGAYKEPLNSLLKSSWQEFTFSEENKDKFENTIWARDILKYGETVPEYLFIKKVNDDLSITGVMGDNLSRLKIDVLSGNERIYHLGLPYEINNLYFVQNWSPDNVKLGKLSWQFLQDKYSIAFEYLKDYFKARPYSSASKDDIVYELATYFELDLEEAEEIYTQFITDYWSKKYKTKLSWRELEDLTGWLVKDIQSWDGPLYGVITKVVKPSQNEKRNLYYSYGWRINEEDAIEMYHIGSESSFFKEDFLSRTADQIIPIRKVEKYEKFSWKELSYTGRVLEWLDRQSAKNLPDSTIKQILYGAGFRGDNIDYLLEEWKKYKRSRYSNQDFDSYKDQNVSLYRKRLNYYNENEGANIFWSSKDAQEKRFKALTDIGNLEDTEILDVGCGYCDLYDYLKQNDINVKNYVGVDIVPEIVEKAKELHPDINIQVRDIQEEPLEENSFDWVFGSGIFALQDRNWQQYVINMLKEMLKIARKGVAVNFLKQQNINRLSWIILRNKYPQIYKWLDTKANPLLAFDIIHEMMIYFEVDEDTAKVIYNDWFNPIKEKLLKNSNLAQLSWKEVPKDLTGWLVRLIDKFNTNEEYYGIVLGQKQGKIYGVFEPYEFESNKEAGMFFNFLVESDKDFHIKVPLWLNTRNFNIYPIQQFNINKKSNITQLMYVDPNFTYNFIRNFVTDKVELKENYLDDDFTIFLFKE